MKKTLLALLGMSSMLTAYSAFAADAVAPAEVVPDATSYVRICDAHGAGYFFIPGSETCLKISGDVSFTVGDDSLRHESFSGAEAAVQFDTKTDTEYGDLGTTVRLSSKANYNYYYGGGTPERQSDVELAYITLGPAYVGYKETLFNTDLLYGDFDAESLLGDLNTTTIGILQHNIAGSNFYAGLAVEDTNRGDFSERIDGRHDDNYKPDVVGRVGIENQPWGTVDVSGLYSDDTNNWFVKGTGDLKVGEQVNFRLSAGYGQLYGDKELELSAAGKYAFSEKLAAFTGVGYFDDRDASHDLSANVGLTFTPVTNLDVTGQLTYGDLPGYSKDDYNTKLVVTRKF